jgi:hypothetical protein
MPELKTYDEIRELAKFSHQGQKDISEVIINQYNLSNPDAVKAAIRDAVWQGFVAGLDIGKQYEKHI